MKKVEKVKRMEANVFLPISTEVRLMDLRPARQRLKLIQAKQRSEPRDSGVADVSILMVYIEQAKIAKVQE